MSLMFMEGFDHYNDITMLNQKWTYALGGTSCPGRFNGYGWQFHNESSGACLIQNFTQESQVVLGMAFNIDDNVDDTSPLIQFRDTVSDVCQIELRLTDQPSGHIWKVYRGDGTLLASSPPNAFASGYWNYLEFKLIVSDTVGVIQLRLNGNIQINEVGTIGSPIDTKNSSHIYTDQLKIYPSPVSAGYFKIDDVYLNNAATVLNNDFLGEVRIQTNYPSDFGATNQFTPVPAVPNWQNVDDHPHDGDTSYNLGATIGHEDLYKIEDFVFAGTVFGVQLNLIERKDDVGDRTITPVCRIGVAPSYEGALFSCYSDYKVAKKIWDSNPATSTVWTTAAINSANFGIKIKG